MQFGRMQHWMISVSNNDVDITIEKLLYYTTPCFEALTKHQIKIYRQNK